MSFVLVVFNLRYEGDSRGISGGESPSAPERLLCSSFYSPDEM